MTFNYIQAAERQFDAAKLLHGTDAPKHHVVAGHIVGLAAECGLKALLGAVGHLDTQTGGVLGGRRDPHYCHIEQVWPLVQFTLTGRNGSRIVSRLPAGHPFSNYSVDQRYADKSDIPDVDFPKWMDACEAVLDTLQWAKLDGLV